MNESERKAMKYIETDGFCESVNVTAMDRYTCTLCIYQYIHIPISYILLIRE